MPKRKSPPYELEEIKTETTTMYYFNITGMAHMFDDKKHAESCLYFTNEAYAHGYRNGMRAGKRDNRDKE